MAAIHDSSSPRGSKELETKFVPEVAHAESGVAAPVTRKMEAPPLIRELSPEGRVALEKQLKRKIDLRLMPMAILMYIMNYLDRNNIAAVGCGIGRG